MANGMVYPQSGVIPVRKGKNGLEILLVTSRDSGRWVLPKGNIKDGLSPVRSAAEEAYEEAGILGKMARRPVGAYKYDKPDMGDGAKCRVEVFVMLVDKVLGDWPEKSERKRKWMEPSKAARLVHEPKLGALIKRAAANLAIRTP